MFNNDSSSLCENFTGGLITPAVSMETPNPGTSTSCAPRSFATSIFPSSRAILESCGLMTPTNSVPRTPMVATGVSTVTFSGFLVATLPEINLNAPLETLTATFSASSL